jgi:two-component system cell cycle sensor histidine kinase/response regulator CckA
MSDPNKTPAQLEAELARLRQEAADLRIALAATKSLRPVEGMPGDYEQLFETLAEALLVVRIRDGLILRANPCCRRLLGLAEGDLAGKTLYHLLPEAVRPRAEAMIREAAAGNHLIPQHEAVYRRPDGTDVAIEAGGAILGDAPDAAALLYLTDRKRAEEALRENRQELQAVQDAMPDGILIAAAETRRFVRANPAICRMLGYTREELLTKRVEDIHPRGRLDEVLRIFEAQMRGEFVLMQEVPCLRKDGTVFFVDINASPITLDGCQCGMGAFRDITERRKAEEALRVSEAELRSVQDAMVDGLVIVDIETQRLVRLNPAAYRMFGYEPGELEGMLVHAIHPPEDVEFTNLQFRNRLQGIFNPVSEIRCRRKDGTVFVADMNAVPITIGGRRCTMGVFRDITERRKAEEALRESEALYRAVVDSQTELVCRFAPDCRITFVNETVCRSTGLGREELVGASFLPYVPEPDRADLAVRLAALSPQCPVIEDEHAILTPVGELRRYHWVNRGVFDEQGRLVEIQAVGRDVTEQRRAEEALRHSEENYRLLFESNMNGIVIIGSDGRIVRANKAHCDIHRFPPEKITGMSPWDLVAPQYREELRQKHEAMFRGEITTYGGNFRIVRGDGTEGWVEVRTGQMIWEGRPARLAIVQDITERVRLENDLREVQKMEAVGQLAGGIAHDFNNLMTGILCSAQLLKTGPGIPKSVYETADVIERAARRAAELTSQLLGFARRGMYQDVPVDLGATIQSVIQLMGGAIDPRITVETVLPPQPVWTHGDPTQMEQVVLNLTMNARDAMVGDGKLTFAAETLELDAAACIGRPRARPGRYVILSVSDTGCGIHKEFRDRIFEPFFTTKPIGKGTGMGLAMVYGIARNHGGWVEVDSEVGQGSTFRVYLPALVGQSPQYPAREDGEAGKKGRPMRAASAAKGRARESAAPCILVVDDNEMVRKSLTRMLAGLGYSVVSAANGREAVATYGMFGSNIDVVIIDMAMPDLDGQECFQALYRLDPNVRAILCTGGPADAGARDMVGKGMVDFLQKPCRAEQLATAIAKALATRHGGPSETPSG